MAAKRILIAGGGTGGHVYPALAIIETLRARGEWEFLYVGGEMGIETRIVPEYQIPMETIWISGFQRRLTLKNLSFPFKLLMSLYKSWNIVRRFKPHVAVGTGGYVSGPVMYVAARMGIPVLIQEQDAYPGVTTRLLAKYARRICLSFEAARQHLDTAAVAKTVVSGNPVRKGLGKTSREMALKQWGFDTDKLTLFIFGGSQGARSINQAMLAILPEILEKYPVQILWQSGEKEYAALKAQVLFGKDQLQLLPYLKNIDVAYAAADVIVARAGASSLAELAIVAKSAILVPYPHAAGNHQEHNSKTMQDVGAAIMVKEGSGWIKLLKSNLETLLKDPLLREKQSRAWKIIARPNAAEGIYKEILKLAGDGNVL